MHIFHRMYVNVQQVIQIHMWKLSPDFYILVHSVPISGSSLLNSINEWWLSEE